MSVSVCACRLTTASRLLLGARRSGDKTRSRVVFLSQEGSCFGKHSQ